MAGIYRNVRSNPFKTSARDEGWACSSQIGPPATLVFFPAGPPVSEATPPGSSPHHPKLKLKTPPPAHTKTPLPAFPPKKAHCRRTRQGRGPPPETSSFGNYMSRPTKSESNHSFQPGYMHLKTGSLMATARGGPACACIGARGAGRLCCTRVRCVYRTAPARGPIKDAVADPGSVDGTIRPTQRQHTL